MGSTVSKKGIAIPVKSSDPSGLDEATVPTFKIVIVGDTGVGKSSFFQRSIRNEFPEQHESDTRVHVGIKMIEFQGYGPCFIEVSALSISY